MLKLTPFLRFWRALNQAMLDQGKADLRYGDARAYWRQFSGDAWRAGT